MDNVVEANIPTTLDIPVERVLQHAVKEGLQSVVVIGLCQNGDFYFGTSSGDGPDILWLLEFAKKKLMDDE